MEIVVLETRRFDQKYLFFLQNNFGAGSWKFTLLQNLLVRGLELGTGSLPFYRIYWFVAWSWKFAYK
jgi:hypothetical protein